MKFYEILIFFTLTKNEEISFSTFFRSLSELLVDLPGPQSNFAARGLRLGDGEVHSKADSMSVIDLRS